MGMRCDQHMGLNDVAEDLVKGERVLLYTDVIHCTYPDGRAETIPAHEVWGSTVRSEESGQCYSGMDGDEYPLNRYIFPDGHVLTEAVQAEPWSSGPCFFIALKDEHGEWVKASLWSQDDIEKA